MDYVWNPWHGCKKISEGCRHCYVYRIDGKHGKDSSTVTKNKDFDLPVKKNKNGEYKIPPGATVYTCFSSDFLLDEADLWRAEAWKYISERKDLNFIFLTKRIHRFEQCMPDDWGDGYENLTIGCTCENQEMANFRIPIFMSLPIKHKFIICEPLLEKIDFSGLVGDGIEQIIAGGESGDDARICDFEWVKEIQSFCVKNNIPFNFKQTGACFKKGEKIYKIPRKYQFEQAQKAGLNFDNRGFK